VELFKELISFLNATLFSNSYNLDLLLYIFFILEEVLIATHLLIFALNIKQIVAIIHNFLKKESNLQFDVVFYFLP
jgi:hypothetical protein